MPRHIYIFKAIKILACPFLRSLMGRRFLTAISLVALLLTTACENGTRLSREEKLALGVVAGAVIGGVVGYNVIGSGHGQLLGLAAGVAAAAPIGFLAVDALTKLDRRSMAETEFQSLNDTPTGDTIGWDNPESGHKGEFRPLRTYLSERGQICRDYVASITVNEEHLSETRRACQNANGDWVRA